MWNRKYLEAAFRGVGVRAGEGRRCCRRGKKLLDRRVEQEREGGVKQEREDVVEHGFDQVREEVVEQGFEQVREEGVEQEREESEQEREEGDQ